MRALVETGSVVDAAEAVGITRWSVYRPDWRDDEVFQKAVVEAKVMAADLLERESVRRARLGLKKYKFEKGKPVLHPELCERDHGRKQHAPGEEDHFSGPCTVAGCWCQAFVGAPYYEHEYSDLLLMFALKAVKPEYRDQVQAQGATIYIPNMGALPQALVARIAAGEHPMAVLSSLLPQFIEQGIIELRPRGQLPPGRP